jgi:hypothetical protein
MGFLDPTELNPATHLPLGHHPTSGQPFVVDEVDRFSGMYILGVAGSGKSALLQNLILEDIRKGHAVVVIDPHLDLVSNCVASMPAEYLKRTYVLDMLDEDASFGINLFGLSGKPRNAKERSQAVDRVMHVLEVLWADVLKQTNLPLYVRSATIALVNHPGMTLLQMSRFLTDKPFRDQLLRGVDDVMTHDHWREHDSMKPSDQAARIQPLLNRLKAIFMGRDLIQNIIGQQTTISFRRAIENREIIFIKLPVKELEQDARLVGTTIIAQISAALFSFADLPESQRPGFSLYVDEFQNFSTPDFASMFTEGRKFGMRVILAHQLRGQLIRELREATASSRTIACFHAKADDAKEMAEYLPAPDDGRLEKVETRATAALLEDPGSDPAVRLFTSMYLRPLQGQRSGGKVKFEDTSISWKQLLWDGYRNTKGAMLQEVKVDDPTQYLDDLLRDVMQSRDPNLDIPPKAVIGFAHCGRGFYGAVKNLRPCLELTADFEFPPQLVAGNNWLRPPKNDREQFLHFLFTLRSTMHALSLRPIGKKADATTAQVAQLLTQLPRRQALVRSGDSVGRIRTYDMPPRLEGYALTQRMQLIQTQTRAKYCHSHVQVQRLWQMEKEPVPQGVRSRTFEEMAEIAGWGKVGEP